MVGKGRRGIHTISVLRIQVVWLSLGLAYHSYPLSVRTAAAWLTIRNQTLESLLSPFLGLLAASC